MFSSRGSSPPCVVLLWGSHDGRAGGVHRQHLPWPNQRQGSGTTCLRRQPNVHLGCYDPLCRGVTAVVNIAEEWLTASAQEEVILQAVNEYSDVNGGAAPPASKNNDPNP